MNPAAINNDHVARHDLFAGLTGMGKSFLMREQAARDPAPWKFAFDTYKMEFTQKLGWDLCIDMPQLVAALKAGRPSAFWYGPMEEAGIVADPIDAFNLWIRWVWRVGQELPGRKLVQIEEVESTTAHQQSPISPAFRRMLDQGRGLQFDVLMSAQALARINQNVRATLTSICSFHVSDVDQLAWLREEGFDPERVKKLVRSEYIWRERLTGKERTNVRGRK